MSTSDKFNQTNTFSKDYDNLGDFQELNIAQLLQEIERLIKKIKNKILEINDKETKKKEAILTPRQSIIPSLIAINSQIDQNQEPTTKDIKSSILEENIIKGLQEIKIVLTDLTKQTVANKADIKDIKKEISSEILNNAVEEEFSKQLETIQLLVKCINSLEKENYKRLKNILQTSKNTIIREELIDHNKKINQINLSEIKIMIYYIDLCIDNLFLERSNIIFARKTRQKVNYKIRKLEGVILGNIVNFFMRIIQQQKTPTKVLFGLLIGLPIYLGIPLLYNDQIIKNFSKKTSVISLNINTNKNSSNNSSVSTTNSPNVEINSTNFPSKETAALLLLIGSAGALGSIISILTRIENYTNKEYEDSSLPIFIGAFKPLIGASFAILLFAIVSSKILPINISAQEPETKSLFFFSLSFIVGFSERFANDIVSKAENSIYGSK